MPSLRRSHKTAAMSGSIARIAVGGRQPVFGQVGIDRAVLDHHRVIEQRHIRHAALGVPRLDIGPEQGDIARSSVCKATRRASKPVFIFQIFASVRRGSNSLTTIRTGTQAAQWSQ